MKKEYDLKNKKWRKVGARIPKDYIGIKFSIDGKTEIHFLPPKLAKALATIIKALSHSDSEVRRLKKSANEFKKGALSKMPQEWLK